MSDAAGFSTQTQKTLEEATWDPRTDEWKFHSQDAEANLEYESATNVGLMENSSLEVILTEMSNWVVIC